MNPMLAMIALFLLATSTYADQPSREGIREQVLSDVFPMTKALLEQVPPLESHEYRVTPGVGLRLVVPDMGPARIPSDFTSPALEIDESAPIYFDAPPHGDAATFYG